LRGGVTARKPVGAMTLPRALKIGTRGSPLALIQAREVQRRLGEAEPALAADGAVEIVVIRTTGDRVQDRRLAEIGGKGLFIKEIEEALTSGAIDLAVHSLKDMETWLPDGLAIGAVLPREDPRDAWFSRSGAGLDALSPGAVVGTASLRRQAQVLLRRPDLRVAPLRGNVETRLGKLADGVVEATILALAGLIRLGQAERTTATLDADEMLPAVGQGAIAVEIRAEDEDIAAAVAALNHGPSRARAVAERALLAELDGSCRTPIAALATLEHGGDTLRVRGLVALPDGSRCHRVERTGAAAEAASLGREAGRALREAAGPDFFAALSGT
jgi:hydroxymethylbilane synthase